MLRAGHFMLLLGKLHFLKPLFQCFLVRLVLTSNVFEIFTHTLLEVWKGRVEKEICQIDTKDIKNFTVIQTQSKLKYAYKKPAIALFSAGIISAYL